MVFPLLIPLGPVTVQAHLVFEMLAYAVGFRLYLRSRRRRGDVVASNQRWTVVVAAIAGAALGSKVLYWLVDPVVTWAHRTDAVYLMAGKTIVGGLLGGWLAVEGAKRAVGISRSTGDLFVIPLLVGTAIGRIGCFLGGLPDRTYGIATTLPIGVDFGDGVRRHPTQLYECVFAIALACFLARRRRAGDRRRARGGDDAFPEGALFKAYLVGYLAFRVAVDFIKPGPTFAGLQSIQWAALIGAAYLAVRHWRALVSVYVPR